MINIIKRHWWYLLVVSLVGLPLGSYLSTLDVHDDVAFWWKPIVKMQGELSEAPVNGYAILHIYGQKFRGLECKYKGLQAFGDRVVGLPVDLRIQRVDLPPEGTTKPVGTYDIGFWRVWPVEGVDEIRVYVTHHCTLGNDESLRVVDRATMIAKVKLP